LIDTAARLKAYPFSLESELRDAANEHGYRIGPEQAAGWMFFRSASAPGEIALAATAAGMDGPFFLSVEHPGAAREIQAERAFPAAKGHAAALTFPDRTSLFDGVRSVYRLSVSLPTLPYEQYLRDTAHLGDTEADRIQKVRIGQDRFRDALMTYWHSSCPLTGISNPALLRASHIVPWAKCDSDEQRLDVHNGLLLSSLWDAAFDAGLVTFDELGRAVASPRLCSKASSALGIENAPPLSLTDEHRIHLRWHREHVWQSSS
jgi:putative restriction endonuclease